MGGTATAAGSVRAAAPPGGAALADLVARRPHDTLVATVVGPGGTGKTLLLDALDERYRAAGVPVLRAGPGAPVPGTAPGAVLVDDAHLLDPAALHGLRALAGEDGTRLVLAHRSWPRPDALAAFTAEVGARRHVAVVGHLDRRAVAERLARRSGGPVPDAMAAWVHDRSGGLPVLVDLVARTLVDAGLLDVGRRDPGRPERFRAPERFTVSVALAERLRHRVDALPPPVQELLTALAHGAALDHEVLGPLLGRGPEELADTVEATRATGLLTPDGRLIPVVGELFGRLTAVLTGRDLHRRVAAIELGRGGPVLEAGRRLLGSGAAGDGVAAVFHAAAAEAEVSAPELTAQLLGAAVDAGHPAREVAGRRALGLALVGDLGGALREADAVLADPGAPDRAAALRAAAVALAHRGLPERAVELLLDDPAEAPIAAPTLALLGRVDEARAVLAPGGATLRSGAARLFGTAAVAAATGCPTAAARLARVTTLLDPVAAATALPDTPAALTAVVALLGGNHRLAESALRQAIGARHGGRVALLRHRLLLGWVLLATGRPGPPAALLARLQRDELEPRDALLAVGLDVALARRRGDAAGLAAAWAPVPDALARQPVDLTTVPVLAELVVAAAQLGEEHWTAGPLAELDAVLDAVGRPALWDGPLAWGRLQAALVTGDLDAARELAAGLAAATGTPPHGAVLSAAAAAWTAVLDGDPDPADLVVAARRMAAAGLGREAAQLAGAAAAAVSDRRAAHQLHAVARTLGDDRDPEGAPDGSEPDADDPAPAEPEAAPTAGPTPLTEREREIGALLLDGLTYKQVGTRLYLSAKTVEHYVARMRQRLGVTSRDELFALLRAAIR